MKHFTLAVVLVALSSSCALKRFSVETLDAPVALAADTREWRAEFDRDLKGDLKASLGDTMFILKRYRLGEKTLVISPPGDLLPFPPLLNWRMTHTYNNYPVFTSTEYYGGGIGFLADGSGNLMEPAILMQISGAKAGRSWRIYSKVPGKAFVRQEEQVEIWGLRYGGRKGDQTEFQIIDRLNPNVTQVVQYVSASDAQLRNGFLVKGVSVKVTSSDVGGSVIHYSLADLETLQRVMLQSPPSPVEKPAPRERGADI